MKRLMAMCLFANAGTIYAQETFRLAFVTEFEQGLGAIERD